MLAVSTLSAPPSSCSPLAESRCTDRCSGVGRTHALSTSCGRAVIIDIYRSHGCCSRSRRSSRNKTKTKLNKEAKESRSGSPGDLALPGGGPEPRVSQLQVTPGEMARQDPAPWLRAALLLLWVPGCLSVSGPRTVRGTVGGSLSVQCRYEEEFRRNKKYWCGSPCLPLRRNKIVETTESEREVRNGRVSIRDHPANLTFTVTVENLTKHDEGTYGCGITVSLIQAFVDDTFEVEVIVYPAPIPAPTPALPSRTTAKTTTTTTATTTAQITTLSPLKTTVKATHRPNGQEDSPPSQGLPVLLSLLALLLFLLGGASLLAWRMVRRRIKADKNPEPLQNPSEAALPSEPCYANLELQTWALLEEPVQPVQVEVEYSTVKAPQEDPQYTTVVFNSRNQDAKDNRAPSQRPQQPEPEYSEIKKT